jgi:hypothetical protein
VQGEANALKFEWEDVEMKSGIYSGLTFNNVPEEKVSVA